MDPAILYLIRCPLCKGHLLFQAFKKSAQDCISDGVAHCQDCHAWFPIEDEMLDLLTGNLAYPEDRFAFWNRYKSELESLNLSPDLDRSSLNSEEDRGFKKHLNNSSEKQDLQCIQQEHFDWYAANDQQNYSAYEKQPFWVSADKLAFNSWRKEIKAGRWLLDIGCAEGRSTFKLMDQPINILGFDVSRKLVRQAIARYRSQSWAASASFFTADANQLPFQDNVLDYILIYGVLHHLPEPFKTCHEVIRVLKPGGVYFGSENNDTVVRKLFDLLQKIMPIWYEEAGPEALISSKRLRGVFDSTNVTLATRSTVFVPPHLINLLGYSAGYHLLSFTDFIGQKLPFIKENGGLILISVKKEL